MKKFLFVLLILLLGFGGYLLYDNYFNKGIPKLDVEEEVINIDNLFIYGTYLNMHGNLVSDSNLELVLYNGEFLEYKINSLNNEFNMSDNINDGLYLEDIPVGTYYLFLRSSSKDDKDNDIYKYYTLNNTTEYKETTYYTFSNRGNKILITSDEDYHTLMFTVSKNDNKDIYDVVIDPGHGGMDSGAIKNGRKESEYTMKIANDLKNKLEEYGVKVKLTREEDQLTTNEVLDDYGKSGRAVINHEVNAKFLFSIHMNSNQAASVHGLEIYTADNINYDFAKRMANNIVTFANTNYSTNKINKVFDGIYTRTFTQSDIDSSLAEYENKNMKSYNITTKSNYFYMIRETGGIMTGAYVDNRNEPKIIANPYYNSNVGSEAYLLELAYLTNANDLENMDNNMAKYTNAIADTFKDVFIIK